MNDKYYVIAGTYDQYNAFIRKKAQEMWDKGSNVSLSHFIYVDGSQTLKGISNPNGFFVGTWYNRPEMPDIFMQLALAITDHQGENSEKYANLKKTVEIYNRMRAE